MVLRSPKKLDVKGQICLETHTYT